MKFQLIDHVIEQTADRIIAVKNVSLAEEYLGDHFPTFPVLPGVLMVETMVQAARIMLEPRGDSRLVLGEVRALKFGNFVRPGETLEVEVTLARDLGDGSYQCKGTGRLRRNGVPSNAAAGPGINGGETAVAGRFTMRPIRTQPQPVCRAAQCQSV
jgi:3-hydroxymyristoyl/3-hydroxydecanoyl-(acyl carrier protein) dehydratase